jgi:uncharacterized RDD family membrane protein YckC
MGQIEGPFGEDQLRKMIQSGKLTAQTLVWNSAPKNAERGWIKASDSDIAPLFSENIPLSPAFPAWREPSLQVLAGSASGDGGAQTAEAWRAPMRASARAPVRASVGEGRVATLATRFFAFLLDILISSIMTLLAMIIFVALFTLAPRLFSILGLYYDRIAYMIGVLTVLLPIGVLITSLINVLLLSRKGMTLGKKILGVRIESTRGKKLSFFRNIIVRSLVKTILLVAPPLAAIYLIITRSLVITILIVPLFVAIDLCSLLRKDGRTLHDLIGGTIVISER